MLPPVASVAATGPPLALYTCDSYESV